MPETEKARARAPDPRQKGAASDSNPECVSLKARIWGVTESTWMRPGKA